MGPGWQAGIPAHAQQKPNMTAPILAFLLPRQSHTRRLLPMAAVLGRRLTRRALAPFGLSLAMTTRGW